MTAPSRIEALQAVLSAQHAAVYAYSVIGVHLGEPAQIAHVRQQQDDHRASRDSVIAALVAAAVVPTAPEAQYRPSQKVTDPATAQRWALEIEEACASSYRELLAAAGTMTQRRSALTQLTDSAVAALYWRRLTTPKAPTVAFPGITS